MRVSQRYQVALFTDAGEVTAEGYARVPVPLLEVFFSIPQARWGTITAFGIFDAQEGRFVMLHPVEPPQPVKKGDSVVLHVEVIYRDA